MVPVFSRREAERFTPPGSPRSYLLAPLTFRERQAFRAEMAREGGIYPPRAQLLDGLREAVREASPGNAEELIAHIDAAEADPDGEDRAAQQRLATIEAACAGIPVYATLIAARQRYAGMLPWVAARHALRGWEGDGLPPFTRQGGLLPADLLDLLPTAAFVRLWASCRAGMGGIACWPDAGGVADQAAWIVDAFATLGAIDAELDEDERRRRGG